MNRHRDGFQRVGYREVTTRITESGTRVQTQRSKRRGNRNQRRWFRNYYCRNQGACVIAKTWPTRRWAANKICPKDRYDQLVNRLLRGHQEGRIGHVSTIIK
jgi:hypothetical protein